MSYAEEKAKIAALIKETLATVCKSSLPFKSTFEIDGLIGITLDKEEVFLVKINECTTKLIQGPQGKSQKGTRKRVERKEELVRQICLPIPTEPCVQTLPIIVKQESYEGDVEEEILLDTSAMVLENSEETEEPHAIIQTVISQQRSKQEEKKLAPDKAEQRLASQRMHTAKHNQYMKDLRKKVILTADEFEILQVERKKARERGRLFRERCRLKKRLYMESDGNHMS